MTDLEVHTQLWEYNYEIFRSSQNANAMERLVASAPTAECMIRAAERLFVIDPGRFVPGEEKQIKLLTSVLLWRSEICRLVHREKGVAFLLQLFLKSNDETIFAHVRALSLALVSVAKYSRLGLARELTCFAYASIASKIPVTTLTSAYLFEMHMQQGLSVVPKSKTDALKRCQAAMYLLNDELFVADARLKNSFVSMLARMFDPPIKNLNSSMQRFALHLRAVVELGDDTYLKASPRLLVDVLRPLLRNTVRTFATITSALPDSYSLSHETACQWTDFVCLCVAHDVKIPDGTVVLGMKRLGLLYYQRIYDTMLKHVKYTGADACDFDTDWRAMLVVHLIHDRDWLPVSLGHEHPDAWASRIYKKYHGENPPIPMDLPRPGDRVQRRATELPPGMDRPSPPEGNPSMQGTVRAFNAFQISVEVDGAPPASCWNFALWELECLDDCVVAKEVNKAEWYKDTSGLEVIDLDGDERDVAPKKKKQKRNGPVLAYPVKSESTGGSSGVAESGVRYPKVTLKLKM